jgi:hypothetical protein
VLDQVRTRVYFTPMLLTGSVGRLELFSVDVVLE